ncbi:ribonuclease H-like domain-containing protein [Tanacetum coccineum]
MIFMIKRWRNFAPTAILTKSSIVPISTARQRSSKAVAPLSAARPINTATPKLFVNVAKTKPNVFQKAHSLSRRPFNLQTTLNNRSLNNKVNTTKINSVNSAKGKRVTSGIGEEGINAVKSSACWVWRPNRNIVDHTSKNSGSYICDPQVALKDTWIFDSGCSRHMTGNKSYLTDYQDYDGGFVAFAGSSKGGRITGKGKIKTGKLDFEDVYFVKELKFNLFSVSQMCDKKNSVLFTETECLILSPDFKLPDENQVMLKIPRKDNMYSFDLKNVVPSKGLTCLIAKATNDESNMWHRRLGHINFKTINKLVKGNLVRGLPSKIFENDHSCVACQKGKQHKASCKFDGKADEGFLVGYFINNKDFRVFNSRTRKEYILLPLLHISSNVPLNSEKDESPPKDDAGKMNEVRDSAKDGNMNGPGEAINTDRTNRLNTISSPFNTDSSPLNTVSSTVNTVSSSFTTVDPGRAREQRNVFEILFDPLIPDLEDTADL